VGLPCLIEPGAQREIVLSFKAAIRTALYSEAVAIYCDKGAYGPAWVRISCRLNEDLPRSRPQGAVDQLANDSDEVGIDGDIEE
jgi:hypothetical protein